MPDDASLSYYFSVTQETRPLGSVSTVYRKVVQDWRRMSATVPCDGCTACCRAGYEIELTADEATHLPHIRDGKRLLLPRQADGTCALLQDNRCSIYAQRPRVCRGYDCRIFSLSGFFPSRLLAIEDFRPFRLETPRQEDRDMEVALRLAAGSLAQTCHEAEVLSPLALAALPRFLPVAQQMTAMIDHDPMLRASLVETTSQLATAVHHAGGRMHLPVPLRPGNTPLLERGAGQAAHVHTMTRRAFRRRCQQRSIDASGDPHAS